MMTENVAEALLVALLVAVLLPGRSRLRYEMPRLTVSGQDREKSLLKILIMLSMVCIPVIDALVPWFEFANLPFIDDMAWAGLVIGLLALALFYRAQADRETFFGQDAATRPPVLQTGIYCYIRHPIYAAMLLWSVAQLLLLQNWLAGPVAALTFVLVYSLRMPCEEEVMLQRHGHDYLDYMTRTGRLLPRRVRIKGR